VLARVDDERDRLETPVSPDIAQVHLTQLQPLRGLDATLTQIRATFKGKVAKHYVVSSTGCKGGKWSIKSTLAFAARSDGAAVPAAQSITDPVTCSK